MVRNGDPITERMAAIERRQAALEERLDTFEDTMTDNTRVTNSVKIDTAQIVALFKASQLGAILVKWLAIVGSALIVGYAAYRGLSK